MLMNLEKSIKAMNVETFSFYIDDINDHKYVSKEELNQKFKDPAWQAQLSDPNSFLMKIIEKMPG